MSEFENIERVTDFCGDGGGRWGILLWKILSFECVSFKFLEKLPTGITSDLLIKHIQTQGIATGWESGFKSHLYLTAALEAIYMTKCCGHWCWSNRVSGGLKSSLSLACQVLYPGADLRCLEKRMCDSSPKGVLCWATHVPKELWHPPKLQGVTFSTLHKSIV